MAWPDEGRDGAVAARLRQSWWWLPLLYAAGVIAIGAAGLVVAIIGAGRGLPLLPIGLLLLGGENIWSTIVRFRWQRDLGPVLRVGASGLSIVGTEIPWNQIAGATVLGPGWAIFGFGRARLAVVSTGAVRFARRTRRRPDRIVVPLSDLDRTTGELLTALRRFAPPGVLQE